LACGEFAIVYVLKLVDVPVREHQKRHEKLTGASIHRYSVNVKANDGAGSVFNRAIGRWPYLRQRCFSAAVALVLPAPALNA
jgi:hypothetical protein